MSSPTRLENLGRLQEKKQRAIALSLQIHNDRQAINAATNPHRPIDELDTKALCILLDRLHHGTLEHRRLCDEITALCEDLGELLPNLDLGRG